jgi:type IV pilus assembly protein PilM
MVMDTKRKGKLKAPKLKEVIGADFGTQSVRLVGLARDKGGLALTLLGTVYYPKGSSDEVENFDVVGVSREISSFLADREVSTKAVFAGAPSRNSVIRILSFPEMPYEDLRSSIGYEVEQFSTGETGEKIIDFSVLREFQEDGKRKLETLIVAVPKLRVYPYLETLQHAKLELHSLDLSLFATLRALEYKNDMLYDGGHILVHMGQHSSDVVILEDGFLKFTRNIKIGGQHITDVFMDAMRVEEGKTLDPSEIDSYEIPTDQELYIQQILNEVAVDIEHTVHFAKAQEQRSDIHINKIILSGFGVWPNNLHQLLSDRMRLQVILANPFGYDTPTLTNVSPNDVCEMPSDYVAAFGLALEGLGE